MNKEMKIAVGIGVVALIAWLVAESVVKTTPVQAPCKTWKKDKASGAVWQKPVAYAPSADEGNANYTARVM